VGWGAMAETRGLLGMVIKAEHAAVDSYRGRKGGELSLWGGGLNGH